MTGYDSPIVDASCRHADIARRRHDNGALFGHQWSADAEATFGCGPVIGDGLLRVGEFDLAAANGLIQSIFHLVFAVRGGAGFGPEVAGIFGCPAELQRNQSYPVLELRAAEDAAGAPTAGIWAFLCSYPGLVADATDVAHDPQSGCGSGRHGKR